MHDISAPSASDPSGHTVVLTMTWAFLALTEELTPMAHAIADSLEVTP